MGAELRADPAQPRLLPRALHIPCTFAKGSHLSSSCSTLKALSGVPRAPWRKHFLLLLLCPSTELWLRSALSDGTGIPGVFPEPELPTLPSSRLPGYLCLLSQQLFLFSIWDFC